MIQRGGEVAIKMLANVPQKTIEPLIKAAIAPGTPVYTDEYEIHARLGNGDMSIGPYAVVMALGAR